MHTLFTQGSSSSADISARMSEELNNEGIPLVDDFTSRLLLKDSKALLFPVRKVKHFLFSSAN